MKTAESTQTHTHTQEADRRAFERARDEAVANVDDWCQGEIAALRAHHSTQLSAAVADGEGWRTCAASADARAQELTEVVCAAREDADMQRARADDNEAELLVARADAEAMRRANEEVWHEPDRCVQL